MGKEFLFSVIIPVYNVEEYLEETVGSVIRQSIGFQDNIELVLVNNGTQDNCGEICEKYAELYPDNVKYIILDENVGPGGGRNIGAQYATGEYINFLDSDDKWGKFAFERVRQFFERNPDINIAACREKRFDAINGWHIFDYIFDKDREIIDIFEEPDCVWFASHSLFIKRCLVDKYRFDETMENSEDMKYVNEIILAEGHYGIVAGAVYYYRERANGASIIQNYQKGKYWYFNALPSVMDTLLPLSEKLYGECIPYLRWLFMFNLQGRTRSELPTSFSEEECEQYRKIIRDLLQLIDDEIIWEQRLLNDEQKINVLKMKYSKEFGKLIGFSEGVFYFNDIRLFSTDDRGCLALEQLNIRNNMLYLTARTSLPEMDGRLAFSVQDTDGNKYEYTTFPLERKMVDRRVASSVPDRIAFRVCIPLKNSVKLQFVAAVDGRDYPVAFRFGRFFPLTSSLKCSHYYDSGWCISAKEALLKIRRSGFVTRTLKQSFLWFELLFKGKKKSLLCHIYVYFNSLVHKQKKIWIISDRKAFAGDNGEYLFKYISEQNDPGVDLYFSIDSTSPDAEKLTRYGAVLDNRSRKFKLKFLLADKIISSHFDNANMYPLGVHEEYMKDLIHFKRVYLQHGVIKDDLTMDNGKFLRDISGFITSGRKERESLLSLPYGYCEEDIWLTGLARFDAIRDFSRSCGKTVVIAPTWRDYFKINGWCTEDGLLEEYAEFTETAFFKFYYSLLNDRRLIEVMKKYGYAGIFRLHPLMMHFAHFFDGNEFFSAESGNREYQTEIESTALFITDYSSGAFDYAYAYRPCIYTQFDRDEFISGHTYTPGYYDYERDGFGPVCYDYESTVKAIISAIENGCVMEEKYHKRAEEFFAFRDGKNCERIYQEILKLDQEA